MKTSLSLALTFPKQVCCPTLVGIMACVIEERDLPCFHVPVPAPPLPPTGETAGQLTPDFSPLAEPPLPLG